MAQLLDVLEKFQNRKTYQELDRRALEISRKAASGNLGEGEYADWALISNDPLVVVNVIKTFITVLSARLSANPFRPDTDELTELGINLRLNPLFSKVYEDVLNDGYAYVSLGLDNGQPVVKPVDARFIMFTGDDPTLRDSKDILIFNIIGKGLDEDETTIEFPEGYVEFDRQNERVEVSHYYKNDEGVFLDIYDKDDEPREHIEIPLSRIPIVRFVGNETELEDKRIHYRGLYHHTAPVFKAMTLAATKLQIHTAMMDDDNYLVQSDAITNHMQLWQNAGVKTYDSKDSNGQPIQAPTPIPKDTSSLIQTFQLWKDTLADMLGPVVQSSSEAVTREEVLARNEIRDAITNNYLSRIADSISEVYRILQEFLTQRDSPVVIQGGYLEQVKREKQISELTGIYQLAKESGLNTQGFAYEFLMLADLDKDVKERVMQTFNADPNASPFVQELKQTIEQGKQLLQQKDQQIAVLRTQATQRLERQSEYVAMVERTKRMELAFKQWQQEAKDAQQGRLEFMKAALANGNIEQALQALDAMERRDSLVLAQDAVQHLVNQANSIYTGATEQMVDGAAEQPAPIDFSQMSQQTAVGARTPSGWG